MEYSSTTLPSAKKTIRKSSLIILLIPVIIGVLIWNIGHFAYRHGIFYMPPSFITGSTLVFFAVIGVYLRFRLVKPRITFFFVLITGSILLLNLFIHTFIETAKYAPALHISKTFKAPSGWVEDAKVSPYQYFGNRWEKSEVNPLTIEGLQKIAADNNIKNYEMVGGTCQNLPLPGSGCNLFDGDIDGQRVELKYMTYKDDKSILVFSFMKHNPPKGYGLMPYCSTLDFRDSMPYSNPCSPLNIFKYNFF